MAVARSRSKSLPLPDLDTAAASMAVRAVARAAAMGLFAEELPPRHLLAERVDEALEAFVATGIGADPARALLIGAEAPPRRLLERLHEAIEASPYPEGEWSTVTACLGDELTGDLVGVSASSVLRYRNGSRTTPDPVAARLHLLALAVADLAGSYNDRGIRRWFERPRTQLEDHSPAELLRDDWDPADPGPRRVTQLAARLAGPGLAT